MKFRSASSCSLRASSTSWFAAVANGIAYDAAHDRLAEAMLVSRDARAIDPAASIFDGLRVDPDNVRVTDESVRVLPGRIKRRLALYGPFRRWM